MQSLSRSQCRWSSSTSTLLYHQYTSPRPLYHPLRTHATLQTKARKPPKPKPYTPSASRPQTKPSNPPKPRPSTPPSTSPSIPPKPPPQLVIPLQSVLSKPLSTAINSPSTTHPPPLTLPSQEPDLPHYKYYFRLGKAYATFYKAGLKAIWTNYKAERALGYSNSQPSSIHAAVREGLLTRADFQLLLRSRRDVTKLPLFILLWIVCGEFTPLVVIFVTWIVPRTIWIPQQVEAARKEAEERRKMAIKTSPIQGRLALPTQVIDAMLPEPRDQLYKFIAQSYGLYPAWWDKYVPSLIPGWFVKRRVRQRVAEIEVDDFAIARDGGVWRMDEEEVVRACEERGIDVLGRKNSELREELEKQLEWRDSIKLEDAKKMGIKEVQM